MTKPSWTDLNAYVDGELAPDASADIAAAIAADGGLAAQVAALARLKVATGEALAPDPSEVPPIGLVRPARRPAFFGIRPPSGIGYWRSVATGIALALIVGTAGWLAAPEPGPDAAATWIAAVEARHRSWLAADPDPVPVDERAVMLADAPGRTGRVPDLGFAKLSVAHLVVEASGRQPGLYIGYVGANGCRLGLWIGPAPDDIAAGLTERRNGDVHGFTWRIGETGYAVMAQGMDAQRLTAVAAHLERSLRTAPGTRIAGLAEDGSVAETPCTA
jgi:anti-sigma factor RsiW